MEPNTCVHGIRSLTEGNDLIAKIFLVSNTIGRRPGSFIVPLCWTVFIFSVFWTHEKIAGVLREGVLHELMHVASIIFEKNLAEAHGESFKKWYCAQYFCIFVSPDLCVNV